MVVTKFLGYCGQYVVVYTMSLCLQLAHGSLFDPHMLPATGPFVETWYMRITDFDTSLSVGIHFGHVIPETNMTDKPLVMASMLIRNCTDDAVDVCDLEHMAVTFPADRMVIAVKGHRVSEDPDLLSPPNFEWQVTRLNDSVGGLFEQAGSKTTFTFRVGDMSLRGQAEHTHPWNTAGTGPESWLGNFPLHLHWFVFSLQSELISYTLQNVTSRAVVRGTNGAVHLEKKWGQSGTPDHWVWSEGVARDGSNATFALSGSAIPLRRALVDTYLIGYRNPATGLAFDFRPDNSVVTSRVDGCGATVHLRITAVPYEVHIRISAPPESFSTCQLGAGKQGFKRAFVQSYGATAEISVTKWKFYLPWSPGLTQTRVFSNVGLGFGGTHVCGDTCNSEQ